MNSSDLSTVRLVIFTVVLPLLLISQLYWLRGAWRLAGRVRSRRLVPFLRVLSIAVFALLFAAMFLNFRYGARSIWPWRSSAVAALATLWLMSGLLAFLAVQIVALLAWLWHLGELRVAALRGPSAGAPESQALESPERRRFVHGTSVLAGASPFAAMLYGFAFERLHYQVQESELPLVNLPPGLSGMRIAQLSDVHMSTYMTAADVRRAVDIANELRADLTVVTGDFITRVGDPLEACIAELSRLRAPLGVWGCNGNHEIYARVEDEAEELFGHYGMRLLRQEAAVLAWRGHPFNLLGVDYQVTRDAAGRPSNMLTAIEPLVRRDMPNILLSHNPNSFRRAAQLGIELTLAGHTHGGQISVEILDQRYSPARFLTPYVAGLYSRPLRGLARLTDEQVWAATPGAGAAVVYVNRGLGTIGMPVRLGAPPEITLHKLVPAETKS